MKKNKSSISKKNNLLEIGEFWDSHDLIDFIDQTEEILFDIDIKHKIRYYAIDEDISNKINSLANKKGIKPSYLINVLLKEKLEKVD